MLSVDVREWDCLQPDRRLPHDLSCRDFDTTSHHQVRSTSLSLEKQSSNREVREAGLQCKR